MVLENCRRIARQAFRANDSSERVPEGLPLCKFPPQRPMLESLLRLPKERPQFLSRRLHALPSEVDLREGVQIGRERVL